MSEDKRPHYEWIKDDDLQQIIDMLWDNCSREVARELTQTLENYYGGDAQKQGMIDGLRAIVDLQPIRDMIESIDHWLKVMKDIDAPLESIATDMRDFKGDLDDILRRNDEIGEGF